MNRLMQEVWPIVEGTHAMRSKALDTLNDADLAFSPGGQNMKLGELIRELGEIEYSYLQSFKTFKQDWTYKNTEAGLENSLSKLKKWLQKLDEEMKTTLEALSDADLEAKTIDRGSVGFTPNVKLQLEVYLQALLIFFGKFTIFLRAMNKSLTKDLQDWIG